MIQTIPLRQLTIGMYIVEIPGHPQLSVRQQGVIRSPQVLRLLQQQGVASVMVDFDRSSATLHPQPGTNNQSQATSVTKTNAANFSEELPRAQKLYNQARKLQQRTMENLLHGDGIDLQAIDKTAEAFIDSIFRNADALGCLRLLRDKDEYLLEHSIGVTILMVMFAKHLQISGQQLHDLCVGALLHDVGKIRVPDKVLQKPGKLSDAEFVIMKSHAMYSREIMNQTEGLSPIAREVAAQHHEKLDGSGYPMGLKGDQISHYGRMIAICDIYDALTADRVYRPGMLPIQALKILASMAPHHLDEQLLRQFIHCVGLYPPGSFVELASGHLALVLESNSNPLLPMVKVIYNVRTNERVMHEQIDLAGPYNRDKIVRAVKLDDYRLDPKDYL
ncbi:HD-GYP domain-containing protein [Ferrimonas senticii]|uniref:HD-GYP domain-containing protein n=1 Tax=Ferrimonas senticii TaxID=394566 RepID=UPI000482F462|nr:HD-GYP domain-containing protein [Ferrimonas senticii]